MLAIPRSGDAITSDWLGHVLGRQVGHHRVIDTHEGTTGRAELELEYAEPCDLPRRLFVKLPPQDAAQRQFVCSSGMGRREAMFYKQLSAEVPVRVPRCYHAAWDDTGENYIMLLEHLGHSGCTFRNAASAYSLDYARRVLADFARLHAAYWESSRFSGDLAWLQPPLQHGITAGLIERALRQYGPTMPVVFTDMGELYLDRADAIHRLWNTGPATLIHGDVHDGNLFLDGRRPGYLDWALVARGPGMRDVGYFMAATLTTEDQREHAEELLAWYRERLLECGAPAPAPDELWQQYRWHAAYVWVGAAVTLAMGDAWQPRSYVMKTLERLHLAMEGLDTVAALRADCASRTAP